MGAKKLAFNSVSNFPPISHYNFDIGHHSFVSEYSCVSNIVGGWGERLEMIA